MKQYRCPVCKTSLTKKKYEDALGILSAREKHLKEDAKALYEKLRRAKAEVQKAKKDGVALERKRSQRLMKGQKAQIAKLQTRIKQLEKGTTPQTEGLEFEEKLSERLKREFPDDDVQRKGKGGDVLHVVKYNRKPAGVIIYECKRVAKIQSQHVNQAYRAKQTRHADFAVLVTTGKKKGFSGFTQMSSVLVVAPLGVIALAVLLRAHLIEMMRTKISKTKRAQIARDMVKYITSPQFKNPIEEVIQTSRELQALVEEEADDHIKMWNKRWIRYQKITWDSSQIRENIKLVLHGKKPKIIGRPKGPSLRLPAPSS